MTPPLHADSRRALVLGLVRRAVENCGRAVRHADVVAQASRDFHDWESRLQGGAGVTRALASLVRTGDVLVIGAVRGGRGAAGGNNLMIPREREAEAQSLLPRHPLTWLDYVHHRIGTLWHAEVTEAESEGRKPRALTLVQLREALRTHRREQAQGGHDGWGVDLGDPQVLVNAVRQLAYAEPAVVRFVGGRRAVFVPVHVKDDCIALDASYASDADRVVEAVRRALKANGKPAVSADEVQRVLDGTPDLRLAKRQRVARALSDLAKESVALGPKRRGARRAQRVVRVGRIDGSAQYTCTTNEPGAASLELARRFVEAEDLLRRVEMASIQDEVEAVATCRLPVTAVGRLRSAAAAGTELAQACERLHRDPLLAAYSDTRRRLHVAMRACKATAVHAEEAARLRGNGLALPDGPIRRAKGIDADAFGALIMKADKSRTNLQGADRVVPRFAGFVRRVPTDPLTARRKANRRVEAEYLFDEADALMYVTRTWGTTAAQLFEAMAQTDLGTLRDPAYPLADTWNPNPQVRRRAAAALAFLDGSSKVLRRLAEMAVRDPEPMVRIASAWARDVNAARKAAAATDKASDGVGTVRWWLNTPAPQ